MKSITVNFEGENLLFDYFVDTVTLNRNSTDLNVYSVISKDDNAKSIVGEHFHVVQILPNEFRYSLIQPPLPEEGQKERKLKDVIANTLINLT